MRVVAGAIVVLAGAVLAASGVVGRALPRINNYIGGDESGLAGMGGVCLMLLGLGLMFVGWARPEPRNP